MDDTANLESLETEAEIYVKLSAALVASYVYDDTQFQIGIASTDASRNKDYVLFKLQNLDSRHDLQNDYSIFSGITVQQESFSQDIYECKYAFDYSPSSVGKWQKIEITDRIPCNSMTSPCDSQLQDALSSRNNNLQSLQTGSSFTTEYFYLDRSGPSNVGYFAHVHTCEPQWLYSNAGTSEFLKCQIIGMSDYRWSTPTQMCVENLCSEITYLPENAVRYSANSVSINAYGNSVYFECQNDGTQLNVFQCGSLRPFFQISLIFFYCAIILSSLISNRYLKILDFSRLDRFVFF